MRTFLHHAAVTAKEINVKELYEPQPFQARHISKQVEWYHPGEPLHLCNL